MKNKRALLLICFLLACLDAGAREVSRTTGLSQDVFEDIQEIQLLIENDDVDEAQARIKKLQQEDLSDYELAQSLFLLGYVHYRREDFSAAIAAYKGVLKTENLPLGLQQNVIKTLSQISLVNADYAGALAYLERLLEISEKPQATHYALKAQVLYQLERSEEALPALETAIALQVKNGETPRENWLLLKNAILYQRSDFEGMLGVVQQLVELYPRDRYLLNMAAIYGEMGDSETQLALMEPLYERGSLDSPSHKINLANLYMMHDIPYKAAILLGREIESEGLKSTGQNLEMLAQAWLMAADTERAIVPLSKAAQQSQDGNLYVALGRTYMSLSNWSDAATTLALALKKGKLHDLSGAQLMLGMAQFNQKNYRAARRSFALAGKDPKSKKLSNQWLQYLEKEVEKAKLLDASS